MVSTVPMDAKGQPVRPGVNGGLMRRQRPDQPPVNYINVESVDEYAKKGTPPGAEQVMPKTPGKGMGWFAWLKASQGSVFGIWPPDDTSSLPPRRWPAGRAERQH